MLSRFFLDRPVFAWVIAIMIMVIGGLGMYSLPISQYPQIAPPTIAISASYQGGSAETIENSLTQIIEQKMTGFENLLYMSSTSDSSGSSRIELTFAAGTDADLAWSKVQNKLQLAMTSLPASVQQQGVEVKKSTPNFLLIIGLISEDGSLDADALNDYAKCNLEKVLARISGVGEVETFGSQYAMRVWLDMDKLTKYGLMTSDITTALKSYNAEVSAGQFGGLPTQPGQRLNSSIVVQSLLKTPEEFADIPIRINSDGSVIRVKDVGRTELGAESYNVVSSQNGYPVGGLAIRQAPGANALKTASAIKAKIKELEPSFPKGVKVTYPYDTTPFVRVAIHEVIKTLIEAIFLVFVVMYVFMGNIRATLIPTIAVPVVLLGTFAVLMFFGYSINMLTMFAMVLAIGLLVDDAIVVVENVERLMTERGLSPKEAAAVSMDEITSALIGIGLVLSAVFLPMAFFSGSTGIIYRQFSITIISSMLLSVVVALILTPVLCATMLKPVAAHHESSENAIFFMRPFFRRFEKLFGWTRGQYVGIVNRSFGKTGRYLVAYTLIVVGMFAIFHNMTTSFLPDEDQGMLMVQATLPSGSTLEQTAEITKQIREYFLTKEKDTVESCMMVDGMSMGGTGQNGAMGFVKLKDWDLRPGAAMRAPAIAGRAMQALSSIRNANVFVMSPPALPELGMSQGFDFELEDRAGAGHDKLIDARNQLMGLAATDPRLAQVRPNGLDDTSQYRIDVDWDKAGAQQTNISAIHETLETALGGTYVNNFIQNGRVKRVFVQADSSFRLQPESLNKLYVRSNTNVMAPFSSFATGRWSFGPPRLERFNTFSSCNIQGQAAEGRSTGEAMAAMDELIKKLPQGFGGDWKGISYQEKMASTQTTLLYSFSILVIFLCVAGLYESWTIPFVNLLMLPLGLFGAVALTYLRGLPSNVYFQIGLLTTLGLTTKNAILIIQFAQARMKHGEGVLEATLGAVKTRFRPVMMTSLAFFFGVLPLAITNGAGAGAQNAIGTAVVGGMLSATFIDLLFIPLFFVLISRIFGKKQEAQNSTPDNGTESSESSLA